MRRTPNINGSSEDALVEEQINIMNASTALLNIMSERRPHARDYQLADDPVFSYAQDRADFERMEKKVRAVRDYAEAVAMRLRSL